MRRLRQGALFLLALVLPLLAALAGSARAEPRVPDSRAEITLSFSPVVKAAAPAVVNIYARKIVETRVSPFARDPFFSQLFGLGPTRPRVQNSLGSGVIVDPAGIVVSNYHVVGEADAIRVVLNDGREFDAHPLVADRENDLAVLRLEGARNLPALELADSDALEVGDLVLAIGNPFGIGQTVTSGIISGLARSGLAAGNRAAYFIQTDAPINPGNSGGALVDMAGRLVGINTMILSRSGGSNGIGFAIPSNLVKRYIEAARAGQRRVIRPWLGVTVQDLDASLAEALGMARPQGVLITRLHAQSPLAAAGIKEGDVLLAIAGQPLDSPAALGFRLAVLGVGGNARLTYLADGQERQAEITLAPPPETPPRERIALNAGGILDGLVISNINPAVIDELDLPLDARGVVVEEVRGRSARTGLMPGDILIAVNGVEIRATRALEQIARSRPNGWEILFERGGQRSLIRIRGR
ncbi:trypsin-like peptidase domain-containing protein [Meinhardsimonia xiamenensis]|nr:trypsin-like peptidase domain-containing protein [Meinhardsimonia xiamenensis]